MKPTKEQIEQDLSVVDDLPPEGLMTVELGQRIIAAYRAKCDEVDSLKYDLKIAHNVVDYHKDDAARAVRIGCENIKKAEALKQELNAKCEELEVLRTALDEQHYYETDCSGCRDNMRTAEAALKQI